MELNGEGRHDTGSYRGRLKAVDNPGLACLISTSRMCAAICSQEVRNGVFPQTLQQRIQSRNSPQDSRNRPKLGWRDVFRSMSVRRSEPVGLDPLAILPARFPPQREIQFDQAAGTDEWPEMDQETGAGGQNLGMNHRTDRDWESSPLIYCR